MGGFSRRISQSGKSRHLLQLFWMASLFLPLVLVTSDENTYKRFEPGNNKFKSRRKAERGDKIA
jgi:hypothetical protein